MASEIIDWKPFRVLFLPRERPRRPCFGVCWAICVLLLEERWGGDVGHAEAED